MLKRLHPTNQLKNQSLYYFLKIPLMFDKSNAYNANLKSLCIADDLTLYKYPSKPLPY